MHTPITSLYGHENHCLIKFRLFIDGLAKAAYTDKADLSQYTMHIQYLHVHVLPGIILVLPCDIMTAVNIILSTVYTSL